MNKVLRKTFGKPIWRNNKKRSVVLRLKLPTIKVGELDLRFNYIMFHQGIILSKKDKFFDRTLT